MLLKSVGDALNWDFAGFTNSPEYCRNVSLDENFFPVVRECSLEGLPSTFGVLSSTPLQGEKEGEWKRGEGMGA